MTFGIDVVAVARMFVPKDSAAMERTSTQSAEANPNMPANK